MTVYAILVDQNGNPIDDNHPLKVSITNSLTLSGDVEIKNDLGNPVPVTGTVTANTGLSQPLTNTQLRNEPISVDVNSILLADNASTYDQQVLQTESLGSDGVSPPSITGTGIRGWLRGIYEKLSGTLTSDISDKASRALGKVGLQVGGADVGGGNPIHAAITDNITRLLGVVDLSRVNGAAHSATNPLFADVIDRVGRVLGGVSQSGNWSSRTQDGVGNDIASAASDLVGNERGLIVRNIDIAADLIVDARGAAAAAVTATLPAAGAGLFHYITGIEITAYTTAARTGAATPVTITTTNLNSLQWLVQTAAAIGTIYPINLQFSKPIKATTANAATTIVCPATASVIWNVHVYYYTGS